MDSESSLCSCVICFELFDEDSRCPRILSCGHTFCHSCLVKVLNQRRSCPTCSSYINYPTAGSITINFSIKTLVSDMIASRLKPSTAPLLASYVENRLKPSTDPNVASYVQNRLKSSTDPMVATYVENRLKPSTDPMVATYVENRLKPSTDPMVATYVENRLKPSTDPMVASYVENRLKPSTDPNVASYVENRLKPSTDPNVANYVENRLKPSTDPVVASYVENRLKPSTDPQRSDVCHVHQNGLEMRCMDCKVSICNMCTKSNHKKHRTLTSSDALREVKEEYAKKIHIELKSGKLKKDRIVKKLYKLEERREKLRQEHEDCVENIEKLLRDKAEAEEFCETLKYLESEVRKSTNHTELATYSATLEAFMEGTATHMMSNVSLNSQKLKAEEIVLAIRSECKRTQYGRVVTLKDDTRVYSFHTHLPRGHPKIISFEDLLTNLDADLKPPHTRRLFFQLRDTEHGSTFEVVVHMDNLGSRALNVALLCSGMKGRSYKGYMLIFTLWGFGFPPSSPPLPPVVENMHDHQDTSEAPWKKGAVIAESTEGNSCFHIVMEDHTSGTLSHKIGEVEIGQHLLEKHWRQAHYLEIVDCGLVL